MSGMPACVDILVIGGGPAGTATALRAARLGHQVCLVDRGANAWHRGYAQSLAPGALPLLDALGLRDEVLARFPRSTRVCLLWGEDAPQLREDAGLCIERAAFDAILRDAAARAGAVVACPATAIGVRRLQHGFAVRLVADGTATEMRARIVVDAAGKRSPIRSARRRAGPPLLALVGQWSGDLGGRSLVEAADECWYWAGANGAITAAVFCDPRARLRDAPPAAYLRLIAQSRLLRGLRGAPTQVAAFDATSRHVGEPVEPGLVRVGEAALSLDPLSSQGIQTAIVSGLQAAIVANTWLRRPALAAAADTFYRERHAETVARSQANTRRAYAQARFATPFWRARGAPLAADAPAQRRDAPDPSARLKLAPGVRVTPSAVVRGDFADFAAAIFSAGRAVAFLRDVPVGELAGRIAAPTPAAELVRSWSTLVGEAAAREALGWMWRSGFLDAA